MLDIRNERGPPAAPVLGPARQTTLKRPARLHGTGVHTNAAATIVLRPASADSGVSFALRCGPRIRADAATVVDTMLCTTLGNGRGRIATVEHLLATCAGLGLDNVDIDIDGPEMPAFDGSAVAFIEAIDHAGLVALQRPRRILRVLRPVRVQDGNAFAEFLPAGEGLTLDIEIDFAAPVIGRQRKILALDPGTFCRELSRARSFGFLRDLAALQARGLALGASLGNTVALLEDAVLNAEGLRFPDEFVRHKMLDALGDLALAGAPIVGTYRSYRGGHALNIAALRALLAEPSAFVVEVMEPKCDILAARH